MKIVSTAGSTALGVVCLLIWMLQTYRLFRDRRRRSKWMVAAVAVLFPLALLGVRDPLDYACMTVIAVWFVCYTYLAITGKLRDEGV